MTVLFASNRPLDRAENIKAVWDAYTGEKTFTQMTPWRTSEEIHFGTYDLLVTDEYTSEANAPVIMICHGIGGGKTYGLEQPYPYHTREQAELVTWAIATSEDLIELGLKQSGLPREKILIYGMPRTDAYVGKRKGGGGTGLDKRVYLYAPTFRGPHDPPAPEIDFSVIDDLLTDDELFIIKNHMLTGKTPMAVRYDHIMQVSPNEPSVPYLIDCDVLITDYSSIMFDAHLLSKPVVLFEKDYDAYQRQRGMCMPYPEGYASRHTTDERELVRIMRDAKGPQKEDIACRKYTASACDGHATERVIKLIEDTLNGHETML